MYAAWNRSLNRSIARRKATTCEAMKGLIEEGENTIEAKSDDDVRDAALIAAAS